MADRHAFVLVHSPIGGRGTWEPVAEVLRDRGGTVVVPDVFDDGSPPFWRQHTRCVVRSIAEDMEPGRPLVLVAHNAAGQLLGVLGPVLRDAGCRIAAEILADAGMPPGGRSRLQQLGEHAPELATHVRSLLEQGARYPQWTDAQMRELVPDDDRRQRLMEELRPAPAGYWVEEIPTSVDWPDAPVGALVFSGAYAATAAAATEHGWCVRVLDVDNHLLPLADETRVADELLELTTVLVGQTHDVG